VGFGRPPVGPANFESGPTTEYSLALVIEKVILEKRIAKLGSVVMWGAGAIRMSHCAHSVSAGADAGFHILGAPVRAMVAVLVVVASATVHAEASDNQFAPALRARYEALRDRLDNGPFQTPLALDSSQTADQLAGDLYGVVDDPFARVRPALQGAAQWCDVLILHPNVKACHTSFTGPRALLTVAVGRKHDEPRSQAVQASYAYQVVANSADYLQILLAADSGPFGTHDHRIMLEAVPLDRERTFVHLIYSYRYGPVARNAMAAYLSTLGRNKVGFTIVDMRPDGQPVYIAGVRGMVERNAMRYYLAVVAYLGTLSLPPHERFEKRLADWFTFTERHTRQLHELEWTEYLAVKRREYAQLQAGE
jgi:hypothetical protein